MTELCKNIFIDFIIVRKSKEDIFLSTFILKDILEETIIHFDMQFSHLYLFIPEEYFLFKI